MVSIGRTGGWMHNQKMHFPAQNLQDAVSAGPGAKAAARAPLPG